MLRLPLSLFRRVTYVRHSLGVDCALLTERIHKSVPCARGYIHNYVYIYIYIYIYNSSTPTFQARYLCQPLPRRELRPTN